MAYPDEARRFLAPRGKLLRTRVKARAAVTTADEHAAFVDFGKPTQKAIAQAHPEAKIPREATFWDENLEIMAEMAKELISRAPKRMPTSRATPRR